MIYVFVLVGSLLGMCALLGCRILLRRRAVRRFVRSMKQRWKQVEDRSLAVEESVVARPRRNPRASALELQKVRSLLRAAEKELQQEKIEEGERILIQALTVQPQALDAQAQLAKLYLTTGREAKAEAMYKELLRHRDDVTFHGNLGLAYYRQGKYVEACQAYQEALHCEPQVPERSVALGRACIAARRFEEAALLLEKASMRLSRDTGLLHLLAECYLQLGQREGAEETYRRINRIEPYNEEVKEKLLTLAQT